MHVNSSSAFAALIDLRTGSSPTTFAGPPAPERGGRTYGGQFLAQAVVAAYRTVSDDRRIHSLHGYFLRAGDVDLPTTWSVEEIRDGRSFSTRSVRGRQQGRDVFMMSASFHAPEAGFEFAPAPDVGPAAVPPPDDVALTYVEFSHRHPGLDTSDWFGQDRPMEIRYVNPPTAAEGVPVLEPQLTWTKLSEPQRDHHVDRDAGLAYLSDATLVDHVVLPHGYRWHDPRLTGASLDHAMWFHAPARADEWLLFDQRVEWTGGARGLATGRLYTAAGQLVATCTQEGLIRWAP